MLNISKAFIVIGILFICIGVAAYFIGKIPGVGRLPGDILIKKENFTFYFPVTTSILISIIVSFILWLWNQK